MWERNQKGDEDRQTDGLSRNYISIELHGMAGQGGREADLGTSYLIDFDS